jgi:hypothetical protein
MLKVHFTKTKFLPKFYQNWIFPTKTHLLKFFLSKTLLLKSIFSTDLNWIIFKTNIGLTAYSIISNFLFWRYLRLYTFEDYTRKYFYD